MELTWNAPWGPGHTYSRLFLMVMFLKILSCSNGYIFNKISLVKSVKTFENLVKSPQNHGPRFRVSPYRKILKRGPHFADPEVMSLEKVRGVRVIDLAPFLPY